MTFQDPVLFFRDKKTEARGKWSDLPEITQQVNGLNGLEPNFPDSRFEIYFPLWHLCSNSCISFSGYFVLILLQCLHGRNLIKMVAAFTPLNLSPPDMEFVYECE